MFNIDKIQSRDFSNTLPSLTSGTQNPEYVFFDSPMSRNIDNFLSSGGWTEHLDNLYKNLNITAYTWTPFSGTDDVIAKSQKNLMDLIRYYEGDPYNDYKAKTQYNDNNGVTTYGYGIVNSTESVKRILRNNGVTLPPRNETEAYKAVLVFLDKISADEIRTRLNRVGVNYDNLPNSIKEGLLDLHFNKGIEKISGNNNLKKALKDKDWITALKEMVVSEAAAKPGIKSPGLYRRSFSRIILAARDIPKTPQLDALLTDIYNKAIASVDLYNRTESPKINKQDFTNIMDAIFNEYKKQKTDVHSADVQIQNQTYKAHLDTSLYSLATIVLPNGTKDEKIAFILEVLNLNPDLKAGNGGFDRDGWPLCNIIKANSNVVIPEKYSTDNAITQSQSVNPESITETIETSEDTSNLENMMTEFGESNIINREIGASNYKLTCRDFIYTVEQGNTLWRISNSYNIDLTTLKQYNNLTSNNIVIDQKIKIPKIVYTVKNRDTLNAISRQFGISVDVLKDLNSIDDVNKIKVGQELEIPGYPYIVKRGDSLYRIAENAGVTLETLKSINGLSSNTIQPGQTLLIVFNDADYNNVEIKTQATRINYYRAPVSGRNAAMYPYYRHHYENGKTVATKEEFAPTHSGPLSGKRIIINAGHGFTSAGHDPGARNRNSKYDESEITYLNAMNLADKLRAQGATVVYIQGGVNLAGNAISKETNSDMMISLHVNSSSAREVANNRVEIYYNHRYCPKGKSLANAIEKNLDRKHTRNPNYAQTCTANHFVTRARGNNIPAVLVELGFLNNTSFRNSTNTNPVKSEIIDAIYQSVLNYNF